MRTISTRLLITALALGGISLASLPFVQDATAAPQPNPVPERWEFRLESGPLRTMVVDTEKEGAQSFYYFTYSVANTTDQDRPLAPSFEISTDLGEVYRSGEDVPSEVYETIINRLKDPLMQSEIDIQGILPQGKENARTGVVVWPVKDIQIDEVTIYAAGFSGETTTVVRPDTGKEVVLRKTLMLRHAVPGELVVDIDDPLERTIDQWIMR